MYIGDDSLYRAYQLNPTWNFAEPYAAIPVWDMDDQCGIGEGAYVVLDYNLQAGSGVSDLSLLIPAG